MNSRPQADEWMEACKIEIATLESIDSLEIVQLMPGMKVLQSTWAFHIHIKRYPDGLVKKLKARFCARGDHSSSVVGFEVEAG